MARHLNASHSRGVNPVRGVASKKRLNYFYALCLFLACLAAWMLGWAIGGQVETTEPSESLRTPETVTDYQTVQEYGVEAQGTYLSYEEYEAHVADQINDRRIYGNE